MSRPIHPSESAHSPRRRRWFLLAGVVLLLAIAIILTLHFRYCLFCSDATRLERAAELLCDSSDSELRRGLYILEQAAGNGHVEALALRGEIYLDSLPEGYVLSRPDLVNCVRSRLAPDAAEAHASFRRLAASAEADPQTLYNLGVLLESGILQRTEAESSAMDYFRRSAETGNPFGIFALGWQAHLRGNYVQAAAHFRAAYEQGEHPRAALLLGDYHLYGHGMTKNPGKAREWYDKALKAAKKPAFKGMVGNLQRAAQQRLQFASTRAEKQEDTEPVVLTYRLEGRPDEYRVFVGEQVDRPIGRVLDKDGTVLARIESGSNPEEQQFATMTEGLDWVLQTYAETQYGNGQEIRFQIEAR